MTGNNWVLILNGDFASNLNANKFKGHFLPNPNVNLYQQNGSPFNRFWVRANGTPTANSVLSPASGAPVYINSDTDRVRTIYSTSLSQQDSLYIAVSIIDSNPTPAFPTVAGISFIAGLDIRLRVGDDGAASPFQDGNGAPLSYSAVPTGSLMKFMYTPPGATAQASYSFIGPYNVFTGANADRRFFKLSVSALATETIGNKTITRQFAYDPDMCVCNGTGSTVPPGLILKTHRHRDGSAQKKSATLAKRKK